jgi:Ca2+-binding RTX toxin-like protein
VGGDTGNDKLYGEAGNDLLLGGDGSDYMYGGSGDDRLFGQIGNDQMFGDAGNDVVVGGNGNDKLYGSSGRDVLIGGLGADSLFGGAGDDVLIAGSTSHDEDDEALQAILAEWAANRSYAMRINNLRSGGGNNGTFTLDKATVLDDGDKDTLQGESNQDWFLIGTNYKIRDRAKNELVN